MSAGAVTLSLAASQRIREAIAEHRTGTIVRSGRAPMPAWVRPYRLATEQMRSIVAHADLSAPVTVWTNLGHLDDGSGLFIAPA